MPEEFTKEISWMEKKLRRFLKQPVQISLKCLEDRSPNEYLVIAEITGRLTKKFHGEILHEIPIGEFL